MKYYYQTEDRIIESTELVSKYGTDKAIPQLKIFNLSLQPDFIPASYDEQPDGSYTPLESTAMLDVYRDLLLAIAVPWEIGTVYNTNDIVKFNCTLWKTCADNVSAFTPSKVNAAYWTDLQIQCDHNSIQDLIPNDWTNEQRISALQELLAELNTTQIANENQPESY